MTSPGGDERMNFQGPGPSCSQEFAVTFTQIRTQMAISLGVGIWHLDTSPRCPRRKVGFAVLAKKLGKDGQLGKRALDQTKRKETEGE